MPSWLLTAPGMCLLPPPPTPPAPVPRKSVTSLDHSLDWCALSKWPASALSCCLQHSRFWSPFDTGRVSIHLEQAEGPMAREVPRDPTAWFMQIVCISPESKWPRTADNSATFSPFHLPPLLAQPAQEKFYIGTVSVDPPAPPMALKSLLLSITME